LRDELSIEISNNKAKEKWIKQLERDLTNCEREISRKEFAIVSSDEESKELRSEISSLKKELYKTKKEVQDKGSYTANIENKLQECYETISSLRQRIRVITSHGNLPIHGQSPDQDITSDNMARTRQDRTIEDYLADVQDGIQRILAQFTPTNHFRIPTERLVNGIDGSLNNIRRLTRDLRQNHAQLNTHHNTL